ncbi:PREDICTED: fatty-acid amide hydrolase 1 [Myotis brandtii]|nr:PREDICTED: fatty-acid amide hydrolase 1 [Myotis brandtii]
MLGPAMDLNAPGKATGAVSYTLLYNCLDFPAGVVPVTTVTLEDEARMEHCRGYFGDKWDKVLWKVRSWGLAWPTAGPPSPGLTHSLTLAAAEEIDKHM